LQKICVKETIPQEKRSSDTIETTMNLI